MMPIVSWASFVPWLKAMSAADTTWSHRKRSFIWRGLARWKALSSTTIATNPTSAPMQRQWSE